MSCDIGHRHGSDLALLWLWCGKAATALILPLAWEPPYATGAAQEIAKKTKKKKKKKKREREGKHMRTKESILVSEGGTGE